jgi:hypothetical protein
MRVGWANMGQRVRTIMHVGHGADIPRRDVAVESRCVHKHCATEANPHQPSCPHTRAKQPSHHHRYPTTTLAHSDRRRHIVDHPIAHRHPREREPMRAPHTHATVSQYGQRGRTKLHVGHGADIPRRDVAVESQCSIKHYATKANPHQPSCPHTRAKQPSHHHRYPTTTLAHSDSAHCRPPHRSQPPEREREPKRAPHTHVGIGQYGSTGVHYNACRSRRRHPTPRCRR